MPNDLVTCPVCLIPNFSPRGLKTHKCKGTKEIHPDLNLPGSETSCSAPGKNQQPGKIEQSEVTSESPKDPKWDQVRLVSDQLRSVGRLFLRGQVRLGMLLLALKKEQGIHAGQPKKNSADSAKYFSWADIVTKETGYSRRQADEFIRLYEAAKLKLKTSKKLNLPAPAKKNAIVLFQTENPLALSDEQWVAVDTLIGTLTSGETQISLMQELGVLAKPKPMPKGGKKDGDDPDEPTAGQLAFHFFEAMMSPFINTRCNPDYKKLLYALPTTSSEENPLSLATLESECRAMLADIEEVQRSNAKPAKGRTLA